MLIYIGDCQMLQVGFEIEVVTELERSELRKLLKTAYPDWHKEVKIVRDLTVAGWELVTIPYAEDVADLRWKQLFSFIKKHSDLISTDKTTAFHVNISKLDDIEFNNSIDMDKLYHNLDIKSILAKFNRVKTSFCRSPDKYLHYNYIDFNNLKEITLFLNDDAYRQSRMDELRKKFNEELSENRKNIPIADKKYKGKRYFEFRMIGGADYHLKTRVVSNCITQFKNAILMSRKG